MHPTEILLAESQERMCYEVAPENVDRVREIAARFELGCSVIGEVTRERYVCTHEGERVVDVPTAFLAEGAPAYNRPEGAVENPQRDRPDVELDEAFSAVVGSANTASKEWVYRQYDHEVGLRTRVGPGDDAALLAIGEANGGAGVDLAFAAGAEPNWTACDPYDGARAIALEVATNLAVKGATPLAAVDCLNGGNPEKPETFGAFAKSVSGIADACRTLSVPVVGGNVSLYNDSATGPIPPTPTIAMVGTTDETAPPAAFSGEGVVMVVGDRAVAGANASEARTDDDTPQLGGTEYLARFDGSDAFPALPADPTARLDVVREVAREKGTVAAHDVSHGGLAVALAEMVTGEAGFDGTIGGGELSRKDATALLFNETPGRVVIETTRPERVREITGSEAPVAEIGTATDDGHLRLTVGGEELSYSADSIAALRGVIDTGLD